MPLYSVEPIQYRWIMFILIPDPGIKHVLLTPVVDGDFLPDEPVNLFHNAAEIDYLAGVNDMDGFSFTSEDIHSLKNKTEKTPV